MKVLILGGVAAGTKVAAKLMREDRSCEVTVLNKGADISYAGCGLPYYVGNVIADSAQLIVNTPANYSKLTGARVLVNTEAVAVCPEEKTVKARCLETGDETEYPYDKLVIAVGARPVKPPVPGTELGNVFAMRTPEDAIALRQVIETGKIKKAVVVGGGYIGLEIAENLQKQGIKPFVLDMASQILPGFDPEMASYLRDQLMESGIPVVTGVTVTALEGEETVARVVTNKKTYKAELVVLATGIRPNTEFLQDTGLEMVRGTILTDEYGQTNLPDIYAVGDCAMVHQAMTGKVVWSPMGSTANIAGRLVAQTLAGEPHRYRGALGTAVCKLPGRNAARTGLTMEQAAAEGYTPVSVTVVVDDKAHYYPGAGSFIVKLLADRETKILLGMQVIGTGAVDKMVDIAVTGITLKASLPQLADMDLAYAPPFSTAIHPFDQAVNILMNKIDGKLKSMTPAEYAAGAAEGYRVVDTCLVPSIEGAVYVEMTEVNGPVEGLDPEEKLLLVCNKGKRAYLLQNRLSYYGYHNTKVLEGGITFNTVEA